MGKNPREAFSVRVPPLERRKDQRRAVKLNVWHARTGERALGLPSYLP